MQNQPLFFSPVEHEKVAGYKLPSNPKHWQSEIIRYLKSQHPYLPLEEAEIDLRRLDAVKGSAVGSVILNGEIAVPVIIGRPRPGADPELAPMDVFFHKGSYRFLDPDSIRHLTHKPQIGEPEKGKSSRARGGNPYIGDMTGDATPLEYSGQASPFAGPFDGAKMSADISHELLPEWMLKEASEMTEKMKDRGTLFGVTGAISGAIEGASSGSGVKGRALGALKNSLKRATLGAGAGAASVPVIKGIGLERKQKKKQGQEIRKIVKKELDKESSFTVGLDPILENGHIAHMSKNAYLDPNDISNFRTMLATNPHIIQGLGNNLQLVKIISRRGPDSVSGSIVKSPNIMQVYKKPDGEMCIKFSGGPETRTTSTELKSILSDRYTEVMSKLKSGDVYMEHDGINQASWDAKRPGFEVKAITSDGLYSVHTRDGETIVGMVITAIMDFDGKTLPMKMLVTPDGKYAIAGEMFGVRLTDKHRLMSQIPKAGQTGVFVNYVHGTPIATLPLRLMSKTSIKPVDGDRRTVYLVQNPMTGERFALSPVQRAQGFERMRVVDPGVQAIAAGASVYYMPGDSEWVELKSPVRIAESADELSKLSAVEEETSIVYSGGHWNVDSTFMHEPSLPGLFDPMLKSASWQNLDEPEVRELLVGMGINGEAVQEFVDAAKNRPGMEGGVKIAGLHEPQIQGFEIIDRPVHVYDDNTIEFAASLRPGPNLIKAAAESGHPETLDSILSLEFITPQNLRYFIDNIPDFEEAATRLAALLIAIRLGMPHVPEQPVKDALEGLSRTVNKLNILKSATDHKNERASSATT